MTTAPSTISTSDGAFRYEMSILDLLWAGRASACEAGGNKKGIEALLWTYASRLVAAHTSPSRTPRLDALGSLIVAHSQPLNPKWREDGEMCRPGGTWYERSYTNTRGLLVYPCDEAHLERRRKCRSLAWDQLAPVVRAAVVAFASGRLPNPTPRSVDFASGLPTKAGLHVVAEIGNTFYSTPKSRSWPSRYVRITGVDGSVATDAAGFGGVLLAAGAVGATLAYRKWKATP